MSAAQTDFKPLLLDALQTLRKRELALNAPFKARAYQTVLQQLEHLPGPIYTMADLATVKGMGEKIREKVQEVFATGHLQAAEKAKGLYSLDAHDALQGVYGIGPSKTTELIQTHGIQSIAALRDAVKETPSLLNDKQRIGLCYYEDLLQRIPREEMTRHESLLLRESPFQAELVGSYRRGAATSGDIDVLLRVPPHMTPSDTKSMFYAFVQRLIDRGYIQHVLALGEHKCMAICSSPSPPSPPSPSSPSSPPSRRLDLLVTPDVEYPFALLYFTGSDRFNVAVRQHALTKGYTMNEHRIHAINSSLPHSPSLPPLRTEEDILHFLGLEYVPPTERTDATPLRLYVPPSSPSSRSSRPVMRRPKMAPAPAPAPAPNP